MTLLERLSAPFLPATISWRVGAITKDKSKGLALAYIDARDVQDRLNEVCGHEWQVKHHYCGGQMLACEIGIKVDGEWLWRGDGAGAIEPAEESKRLEEEQDMARKAAFSDSFKRAAVRWGVGRYLYDIDSPWVALEPKGLSYVIAPHELARLRSMLTRPPTSAPAPTRDATSAAPSHTPSSTGKVKHKKWDYAGARFREIEAALKGAGTDTSIDNIWNLNEQDRKLIAELHPPSYQRLIALRNEMLAKLEPARAGALDAMRTGSAPELMGEP